MTEQQEAIPQWIIEENEQLEQQSEFIGEKLPALQLEENKIVKFEIDFSEKFQVYNDTANNAVKAIIPVIQNGEKKVFWLNKKNPLYRELMNKGATGQTKFAVLQTGQKANTKYNLVEE